MRRSGFTLIELIVSMIAATVLVLALASTVVVTTSLLDTPPDDAAQRHDRVIIDRLASDMRYATSIVRPDGSSIQITRPDPATGASQAIAYESNSDGFTRRVAGGPAALIDKEVPSHAFQLDGYTSPADNSVKKFARLRGTSEAFTWGFDDELRIDLPAGCVNGDLLLLCVAAKTPQSFWFSESGWQVLDASAIGDLVLITAYRIYRDGIPDSQRCNLWPDSTISSVMLCFENVNQSRPIDWKNTRGGYSQWYDLSTHPQPTETSDFEAGELNVQIYAGEGDPWPSGTLGIASFSDAARSSSQSGLSWLDCSIAVAIRTGPTPSMTTTPRLWQWQSGHWLQTGIRLGVEP